MSSTPSLVRLLNLMSAIRDLSPFVEMNADEEILLDDLIIRWHNNVTLTVSEVINDTRYPSSTTAYRRLIALKDKGIIALDVALDDKRVKHIRPTKAALLYIEKLEQGVERMIVDARSA
jgi:CTP-dependent riboflavin kinase